MSIARSLLLVAIGASAAAADVSAVSDFSGRTLEGGSYELFCPDIVGPNPAVVVVADHEGASDYVNHVAFVLAGAGFVTIVVEPSQLAATVTAIDAGRVTEPRSRGCAIRGRIGVWALGSSGDAAFELARAREAAGRPLAAVVAMFPSLTAVAPTVTPAAIIEGYSARHAPGVHITVRKAQLCDLLDPPDTACEDAERPDKPSDHQRLLISLSAQWLRAKVAGDSAAAAEVATWTAEPMTAWPQATLHHDDPPATPDTSSSARIGVPLELGGSSHRGGGFAIGVRPELVFGHLHHDGSEHGSGNGLGIYLDIVDESHEGLVGVGATYVRYANGFAVAPSFGVFERVATNASGVSGSLFIGKRGWVGLDSSLDAPFGLRVDGRFTTDGSHDRAVMVSLEGDVAVIGGIGLGAIVCVVAGCLGGGGD